MPVRLRPAPASLPATGSTSGRFRSRNATPYPSERLELVATAAHAHIEADALRQEVDALRARTAQLQGRLAEMEALQAVRVSPAGDAPR
jgi:hypothetical protein